MYISFATSRTVGFKKWSDTHASASNDDGHPTGATPVALAIPSLDNEQPHYPWLVPGVGVAF